MLELRGENSRKGDDLIYDHVCYACLLLLLILYFTSSAIYTSLLLLFCLKFCFPCMSTMYIHLNEMCSAGGAPGTDLTTTVFEECILKHQLPE